MLNFAPNSQSWWDAVCNAVPYECAGIFTNPQIVSDDQYNIYRELREDSGQSESSLKDQAEKFMLLCFLYEMSLTGDL